MSQNKLKLKVEALTRVVRQLIKTINTNISLAQGTLTAFQTYLGEDEWNRVLEELKEKEKKLIEEESKEKKLEIPEDK
tara:strand:+ start:85 stop:318 length:234 start_codon:yes stop_codon:yes gene_type:complete